MVFGSSYQHMAAGKNGLPQVGCVCVCVCVRVCVSARLSGHQTVAKAAYTCSEWGGGRTFAGQTGRITENTGPRWALDHWLLFVLSMKCYCAYAVHSPSTPDQLVTGCNFWHMEGHFCAVFDREYWNTDSKKELNERGLWLSMLLCLLKQQFSSWIKTRDIFS